MSVYAYLRVSTDLQTVENQRNKIEVAGFAITEWFEDAATSGSKSAFERDGFKQLLAVAKEGDTVVAVEVSRIGRSTSDVLNVIEYLQKKGIKLRIMNLDGIDLTSSTGRLMVTLMASCAQFEKELLVERVVAGLARTKAQGTILGAPDKLSPENMRKLVSGQKNISQGNLAKKFSISLSSVKRHLKDYSSEKALQEYESMYNKKLVQYKLKGE